MSIVFTTDTTSDIHKCNQNVNTLKWNMEFRKKENQFIEILYTHGLSVSIGTEIHFDRNDAQIFMKFSIA